MPVVRVVTWCSNGVLKLSRAPETLDTSMTQSFSRQDRMEMGIISESCYRPLPFVPVVPSCCHRAPSPPAVFPDDMCVYFDDVMAPAECLMASYFAIVRKNFMDHVPKTIMCFLVNQTKGAAGACHLPCV